MAEQYTREDVSVLDKDRIQALFGIKEGFFQRVVDVFITSSPDSMKGIGESLTKRDYESLRKYCHTLKGAAGNIGGARLSAVCADLEAAAREQDEQRCAVLSGYSRQCFDELVESLKERLEE